jgi:hypothetical protein
MPDREKALNRREWDPAAAAGTDSHHSRGGVPGTGAGHVERAGVPIDEAAFEHPQDHERIDRRARPRTPESEALGGKTHANADIPADETAWGE